MTNVYTNHSFLWDAGNWPKCGKHGLKKDEIESLFTRNPRILPDRKEHGAETRYNAVGQGDDGRHLFIVFVVRDGKIRSISARPMHKKEVARYEKR